MPLSMRESRSKTQENVSGKNAAETTTPEAANTAGAGNLQWETRRPEARMRTGNGNEILEKKKRRNDRFKAPGSNEDASKQKKEVGQGWRGGQRLLTGRIRCAFESRHFLHGSITNSFLLGAKGQWCQVSNEKKKGGHAPTVQLPGL